MNRRRIILASAALALVVFLPLRLVLGLSDGAVSARAVKGSVWNGALKEAALRDQPLGDLRAGLSPLHLFLGQLRVKLSGAMTGAWVKSFSGSGLDIETLTLPASRSLGPVRLTSIAISDAHIRFRGERCKSADGRVTVLLDSPMGARTLSGNFKCAGPVLSIELLSQSAMERLALRFPEAGRYEAILSVRAADGDEATRLNAAGFRETAAGHVSRFSGTF